MAIHSSRASYYIVVEVVLMKRVIGLGSRSGIKYALILDAAQSVIAKEGYHRAKISAIAAEAGVAAGTVYLYFANKQDLLVSLFRDRLAMLVEQARGSIADAKDPSERVCRFIRHHLQSLAVRQELAIVAQIELRQADISVQKEISTLMKGYFEVIDEIILEGQSQGKFRQVEPRQIRNMIFGTLDQTVTAWVIAGFRFDLEALAEPTCELIMGGLSDTHQGGSQKHGHSGAA
jgi:TetR/AcrR family fatty acid metabolism transcriptional regulator